MELTTLDLAIDGPVATVTINRPERRNAISTTMVIELHDVLVHLAAQTAVRVVVLTAVGDRFFCPGADLARGSTDADGSGGATVETRHLHIPVLLHEMPQVTVAAVNGACAGAGLGWALACDLRLASSTAVFNTAFLDVGVAGDMGVPWSLPRLVGGGRARDLLLLRGRFDAQQALDMGMLSEVYEPAAFRPAVDAVVARLRDAPPSALRTLKANLVAAERMGFADFVDLESERHLHLVSGPEFAAGTSAFRAQRRHHAAPADDTEPYDEFELVAGNAEEMGVIWPHDGLAPQRLEVTISDGQRVSVIRWGSADPEIVFLHGGGQNAHTWDSVVVAAGRPALSVDLPGHGRSDRRSDHNYGPWENASAVAEVMEQLAPRAAGVVGMSLGGATTIRLAATRPDLVRRAVIVDVTPQVNDPGRAMTPEQRGSVALISGPPEYDSFQSVFDATLAMSPTRTPAAVYRGVRHNTYRTADGRWRWRYDLFERNDDDPSWVDFTPLWDDVGHITVPTMLVLGGDSVYVLPEDVDRFVALLPSVRVETVPGAGHAVQSDQPAALVALLADFLPA